MFAPKDYFFKTNTLEERCPRCGQAARPRAGTAGAAQGPGLEAKAARPQQTCGGKPLILFFKHQPREVAACCFILDSAAGESRPAAQALRPPALNPPHGSCRMKPAMLAEEPEKPKHVNYC